MEETMSIQPLEAIDVGRRLTSKTAFITGSASGIGAATARRLAAEGARVVVLDIDIVGARAVAGEIDGVPVEADVRDIGAIRDAVKAGEDALGPIDILVNNAGGDRMAFFVDTTEEMWAEGLDLNLRSALATTHAVLPGMIERRSGVIVNVASEAGRNGTVGGAIYSAAKAGLMGFTKAIALETVRFGVRCNAVAPGPIDTPMLSGLAEEGGEMGARLRQMMINSTAMRRMGRPDEVAGAIAFLASDDASYITGQILGVSGGL
jgi:2-hydroxycyclohexanecarboxyl-CoA dehydrogenase